MDTTPFWLAGEATTGETTVRVTNPADSSAGSAAAQARAAGAGRQCRGRGRRRLAGPRRRAGRITTFSNYQAGQSCIAVQRVYVERSAYAERVAAVEALDPVADVGPLINEDAARRVEEWVAESGGTVLTVGTRAGSVYAPTVLGSVASSV